MATVRPSSRSYPFIHHHHHHHPSFVLFWCLIVPLFSPLASSFPVPPSSQISLGVGDLEGARNNLYQEILRHEAVSTLHELGKVSDADGHLERTFMSPASKTARNLIREWMDDAGLSTWFDCMGNAHGRVDPRNGSSTQALLMGSHSDTVIDAGKYCSLGIISATSALKVLKVNGRLGELKRPVEVIAFSDEEGGRFQSTFLGSAALAGIMPVSGLEISDKSGVTLKDALRENSIDITQESLLQLKYDPASVWGYVEIHIEQGPVLEWVGYPLGVVKGITGQARLKVTVKGSQGHAGTVPMALRKDPISDGLCNGEMVESLASSLVFTVGEISTWPSPCNVIPGQHDANAVISDPDLTSQLKSAAQIALKRMTGENQEEIPMLMSGAGHDAMAMSHLTKQVGTLFVRCRGGISHSPVEYVLNDDVGVAGLAVLTFLESCDVRVQKLRRENNSLLLVYVYFLVVSVMFWFCNLLGFVHKKII